MTKFKFIFINELNITLKVINRTKIITIGDHMKKITKIYSTFAVLASTILISESASARTEGSYAGFDINYSKASHQYEQNGALAPQGRYAAKAQGEQFGYGFNYKYAFNKDGIFLAPEIFFDRLDSDVKDADADRISLNYRYGAKLNLGYDITDNTAIYVTAGQSSLHYKVGGNNRSTDDKFASLFGGGLSFYPHKNVAINLEYNISKPHLLVDNSALNIDHTRTAIEVYKVGVAYHF